MRHLHVKGSALIAALILAAGPAGALAHGNPHGTTTKPPTTAKAHGSHCRAESRNHVAGQKGTPFSRCVVAAAHKQADHSGD